MDLTGEQWAVLERIMSRVGVFRTFDTVGE